MYLNEKKYNSNYIESMGHAYAHYFNNVYIVFYIIKQENTKFTISFPEKQTFRLKIFQNPAKLSNFEAYSHNWLIAVLVWIERLLTNFCPISIRQPERGKKKENENKEERNRGIEDRGYQKHPPHDFLNSQWLRSILQHVSPLAV